jgi:competence protein ComEC
VVSEVFPCNLPLACIAALCFVVAAFRSGRVLPFFLFVFSVFFIRHDLDWHQNPGRLPIDLLSQGDSVIHVTGIVTSDPAAAGYWRHLSRSRFEIRATDVVFDGKSVKTSFPAEVTWVGPVPVWGDEVELDASIAPVPTPRNPGEFNLAAYLARQGIFAELSSDYPEEEQIVAHGMGNPLIGWGRACRATLQRRLTLGLEDDPEKAGLVETITLGLKDETSTTDRELFQHVGALHLFVVNGLHVALLAGILGFLLKPFRVRRRAFALVIIPILFGYALITGLSPGSVRAAIMAAVMFGASFVERRSFSFNTLAAAALILLLWDTNELYQEGFQFSFGVVTTIILLANFVEGLILPTGLPDSFLPRSLWTPWQRGKDYFWRQVTGLAGVSIAASIGSFPFSAGYFNVVTPSGFVANLFLVPVAFCILAEAVFSLLTSFFGWVPLLFNNVNWLLASAMLGIVHFFAFLPGGYFFVPTSPERPECRATILDLAPGQAIVIESRGLTWLIDCGDSPAYFRVVRPFLQSRGINRLDGFVITHGVSSSMGGAQDVIDDFDPREVFESSATDRSPVHRALRAALENSGRPKTILETGDQMELSPVATCDVLYPPAGLTGGPAADKSLALRIQDGKTRILLMSDSGFAGEHWLLDHGGDLRAAIVVLGGQATDMEGTEQFIGAAHAAAVIRGEPGYEATESDERKWARRE